MKINPETGEITGSEVDKLAARLAAVDRMYETIEALISEFGIAKVRAALDELTQTPQRGD